MRKQEGKDSCKIIVPLGTDDQTLEYLAKAALRDMRGMTDFVIFGIFKVDSGPIITLPGGRALDGEHEVYAVVFDNNTLPN